MTSIKNVALAGASGSLGTAVLKQLIASGKFNVTVLRRTGSKSTVPEGVNVVDVDFASVQNLTSALKGVEAVVSTVGTDGLAGQTILVDAAVAAGVKRFLPSEFGSNLSNETTRKFAVFAPKVAVEDYLVEKSKTSSLTYTFVYNNAFLDWGLENGFLFDTLTFKPQLIDGGDLVFSATTLSSIGDAVAGVLTHPEETKNRAVYIENIKVSQNKFLALSKKVASQKQWEPKVVQLDDLTAAADAHMAKGEFPMSAIFAYLFKAVMHPSSGGNFTKTDNELLGVKQLAEGDLEALLKRIIK